MFESRRHSKRTRRGLARLCAQLEALRQEGLEPAKAAEALHADGLLPSPSVPDVGSEHPLADIIRESAPLQFVAYIGASEESGLGSRVLGFCLRELNCEASPTSPEWLVSAELILLFVISSVFGAFALPAYEAAFRGLRVELPVLTQFMSHLYSPSEPFWYCFLLLIMLVLIWRHIPLLLGPLTVIGDRLALSLPVVGKELRQNNGDVLAGWLGHIGPEIAHSPSSALESAILARKSGIANRALRRLSNALGRGLPLFEAIKVSRDFDPRIGEVLKTASASPADCGAMLRARWQTAMELRSRRRLKAVVIAQLCIGIVIALTVVAMYLPIFCIGSYF